MKTNIYNKVKGLVKTVLPFYLLTLLPLATACSPDSFDGADETQIPIVSGQDFTMIVDQETNQVQVSYPETPGVYPIWIFNGASYSTLNNAGYQNNKKGTYYVEMRLGNRNGFSQGAIRKEFTFNETKANFTTELNRLSAKEWRIDYAEPAHLACGPYGGDGSGWWNAAPGEKKDFGVYDDRISFVSDGLMGGTFTYDPGADGMTYININSTIFDNGGSSADFDTPTQLQASTFTLKKGDWTDGEGNVIETNFLELAPNTLFPYISHDRQYQAPRFRIETLTASKLVLIYENQPDNISWRFIFTNKAEEKAFEGFDANSQFNMWKGVAPVMEFWYAPGWNQIADPGFTDDGNDYTIVLPQATTDQWQAQVKFHTDLTTAADKHYDFSAIFNSDKDLNGATVKLVLDGDDGVFYFTDRINLKAGEDYIFWKSDMPGIDMSKVMLVLDFGGCQDNTTVNVRNIVLKDHANDDGTVLPNGGGEEEQGGVNWVAVDSPDNLGAGFNSVGTMEFWWADGGWSQIGNPGFSFENGVYVITATENGGSEWQAQNSIHHVQMNIEPGQLYAIRATIEASAPVGRFTFKICDEADDDNTLVYDGKLALEAGENTIEFKGVKAQKGGEDSGFSEAKLFIDLGGIAPGTEIRLSDIIVQKYDENGGGSGSGDDTNYGADFNTIGSMQFWWADGSWSQIGNPGFSFEDGVYVITVTENGGSEWQAQCSIHGAKVNIEAGQLYDVTATIEASAAVSRYTFKICDENDDDNTLVYNGSLSLEAGENEVVFKGVKAQKGGADSGFETGKLFIDLGGVAPGTQIMLSNIAIVKK